MIIHRHLRTETIKFGRGRPHEGRRGKKITEYVTAMKWILLSINIVVHLLSLDLYFSQCKAAKEKKNWLYDYFVCVLFFTKLLWKKMIKQKDKTLYRKIGCGLSS